MSYSTTNYTTAPTSPNPYISRKLNNIEEAKMMKKERNNWMKLYYKTLKWLEAMIDVQKQVKDIMKIAVEMNTTITEMEKTILKASVNNRVINTINIIEVSKNLQYLIQNDMENRVFQVQWMLADELDIYKERGNDYVDSNIWEIQNLFKEEENKREEEQVEDKEVILVKPYEVSKSSSLVTTTSFITEEVENLIKYIKFIWSPTQTWLFQPPPHYQSLKSRGEQDPEVWNEIMKALVD